MASVDDFPFDGFNLEEVSNGLLSMIEVAAELFRNFRDPYFAGKLTEVAGAGMVQISDHLLKLEEAIVIFFCREDLIRLSRSKLNNCEPERRPLIERFIEYLKTKQRDEKPSDWAQSHIEWINRVLAERRHQQVAVAVSELLNNPGYSLHRTTKTTYYRSWHEAALEIGIALLSEYYLYLGGSRYRSENELEGNKLKHWLYCWSETNWEEVLGGLRQERIILEAELEDGGDKTHRAEVTGESDTADYIFKKENDFWAIRFNGGELQQGIKDAKALRDIQYLLRHQGDEIDICNLPDNKGIMIQTESTPIATKDDFKDLLVQIAHRRQELDNEQDPLVKEEVEQEIASLERQKNENFDKFGNPRELSGDLKKAVEATQTRVNRWCNSYKHQLPELITHFDKHLSISSKCSYKPEVFIHWDFGEE